MVNAARSLARNPASRRANGIECGKVLFMPLKAALEVPRAHPSPCLQGNFARRQQTRAAVELRSDPCAIPTARRRDSFGSTAKYCPVDEQKCPVFRRKLL